MLERYTLTQGNNSKSETTSWRVVACCRKGTPTKGDFAFMMKQISDKFYLDVEKIIIVVDNLNTHTATSFYEAFPPNIAYDLMRKYEFHYTHKHGSWLNIAESELSSLARQCLGKNRINPLDDLNEILASWEMDRNTR